MDLLKFQSLIGILITGAENKLTPISSDVFISIPERDSITSHDLVRIGLFLHIITTVLTYLTVK